MHRRSFLAGLITIAATPPAAEAQPAGTVHRIGWLTLASPPDPGLARFREGLQQFGYFEGKNITIVPRWAEHKPERLPALAAELVGLNVDIIVTGTTPGISAAKQATTTIPIVMTASADAVWAGLVASLAQPGGNVTGSTLLSPTVDGKRLALAKEVVPKVSRVAMLVAAANPAQSHRAEAARIAAEKLGLTLQLLELTPPYNLEIAFAAMMMERPGALLVLFARHSRKIIDLAAKHAVPAVYDGRDFAEAGGLLSYGPDLAELNRRAAYFVDRILKGAKPADLPIEQPTKFELVINLKTAKALGLTIPPSLLLRADQVIE